MERRKFIKGTGVLAVSALFNPSGLIGADKDHPDIAVTTNGEPEALVRSSVDAMGGMSRFINQGDIVVVKPNISWDRVPKQAATTNPQVVSEVIIMCFEAGAKKVKVFDHTLNEPRRCYKRSGIEKAVRESGGEIHHIYERKFKTIKFTEGELIKSWEVYDEVLESDKVINIPVAKHHSIPGISLAMKNVMGFLGGNRGKLHRQFDIKIADINAQIRSDLIILDAYRMLMRNGPSGGNLADVSLSKTVAVGTDIVAMDSFGASLFKLNPTEIPFLVEASRRGLGKIDLKKSTIKNIPLSM